MPSYSGGLGVLAGDTIRAAADLHLPMVAVSLLYRRGYFTQRLAEDGLQTEEPVDWRVEDFLAEEPARASVPIENRRLELRCWRYSVKGVHGSEVPVYFLDADVPSNTEFDRNLTGSLYGGDSYYRLCQEVVLGVGGVRMLRALGYQDLTRFHMNEGHAALLSLELLGEEAQKAGRTSIRGEDIEKVRDKCVFTTHTPVAAGSDYFEPGLVRHLLNPYLAEVGFSFERFMDLGRSTAGDPAAQRFAAKLCYRVIQATMILNATILCAWVAGIALPEFLQFWNRWSIAVHFALALVGVSAVRDYDAVAESRIRELKADAAREDIVEPRNVLDMIAGKIFADNLHAALRRVDHADQTERIIVDLDHKSAGRLNRMCRCSQARHTFTSISLGGVFVPFVPRTILGCQTNW